MSVARPNSLPHPSALGVGLQAESPVGSPVDPQAESLAGLPRELSVAVLQSTTLLPPGSTLLAAVMKMCGQQLLPGQQFHLVVIPEEGEPQVQTFAQMPALLRALQEQLGQAVRVFAFAGHALPLTCGPQRYVLTPLGAIPLFGPVSAEDLQIQQNGFMGEPRADWELEALGAEVAKEGGQ